MYVCMYNLHVDYLAASLWYRCAGIHIYTAACAIIYKIRLRNVNVCINLQSRRETSAPESPG